jgi:hypothetical protein
MSTKTNAKPSAGSRGSMRKQILRKIKQSPRIPAAQARRLNELIDKSKVQKLTVADERELRRILELVDRTTFWNVASAYAEYWRGVQHRVEGGQRGRKAKRRVLGK